MVFSCNQLAPAEPPHRPRSSAALGGVRGSRSTPALAKVPQRLPHCSALVTQRPILFESLSASENAKLLKSIRAYRGRFDEALHSRLIDVLGLGDIVADKRRLDARPGSEERRGDLALDAQILGDPWKAGFLPPMETLRVALHKAMTSRRENKRTEERRAWADRLMLLEKRRELVMEYRALLAARRHGRTGDGP